VGPKTKITALYIFNLGIHRKEAKNKLMYQILKLKALIFFYFTGSAAARLNGTTYSRLINAMLKKNVEIDRKALAEIAVKDPAAFTQIVKSVIE